MGSRNLVKYKDSGIEWLGEIPEHWAVKRVKDVVVRIGNGVTPKGGSEVYIDSGVSFLRSQNVYDDGLRLSNVSFISKEIHDNMQGSRLKAGDILINITGASIGRTCVVPTDLGDANINQHIAFLRVKPWFDLNYISLFLKSPFIKNYIQYEQNGASKEAFNLSQIASIPFVMPEQTEQATIANYLHTKTAQIDHKIELLSQKAEKYGKLKQSLINETVTRGLDKSVPMKESGIEWIGDVPAHWEVKRAKEIFNISRGRVIAQTELVDDGVFPVYSSQTKDYGCLGFINTFDYDGTYITWTTDGVNAGTVFLRKGKFNCTNICGTLKLKVKQNDMAYLLYALQVCTKHNKRIDTNGAKIMSNEMMFIKISIPPLNEQKIIASYLDEKTVQIEQIIATVNSQINNLKELRKTLINDVVTGKIKVVE